MYKMIAVVAVGLVIFLIARATPQTNNEPEHFPPGFREAMEAIDARAKGNLRGELGQTAKKICNRTHGITGDANDMQDVLRVYGVEKATSWMECVVNTIYPVK